MQIADSRMNQRTMCLTGMVMAMTISVGLLAGCGPSRHKERADREVYGIIAAKSEAVPNMERDFNIEPADTLPFWDDLPLHSDTADFLGASDSEEEEGRLISLEQALAIAVSRNRNYQSEKEALYQQALSLTLERHRFSPIFSGSGDVTVSRNVQEVTRPSDFSEGVRLGNEAIGGIEALTGSSATLLRQYAEVVERGGALAGFDEPTTALTDTRELSAQSQVGMSWLLRSGGAIGLGLTSNFFRFLSGEPESASFSALTGSFVQPLLRGAGSRVAAERLTQAERDVLYALRDFTQFRKNFSVQVASEYYAVLQNRDIARNSWLSYQSFIRSVERERAFAAEGRRTLSELGRLESALLDNENRWINAVRRYRESTDRFKVLLGISTDEQIVLDERELVALRDAGLRHPALKASDAGAVALASRLDYMNISDQVDDATRRIDVAANALLPDLDLIVSGVVPSSGSNQFENLDFRRLEWDAGLDVSLPFDRKSERNFYRTALILQDQALRRKSLTEDNIKLDVRTSWRNLDQAKRNYEIALESVQLNERRVEEQDLRARLGRATVLDQVDAQNDLTDAQNNLTAALVAHTIARLEFWRDMGILYIKENGQWEELEDV